MAKKPFNVTMRFTYAEYLLFKTWWEDTCYYGLNSFGFPQIDDWGNSVSEKEYRFVAGTSPSYSNPSGKYIECSMQWEEV